MLRAAAEGRGAQGSHALTQRAQGACSHTESTGGRSHTESTGRMLSHREHRAALETPRADHIIGRPNKIDVNWLEKAVRLALKKGEAFSREDSKPPKYQLHE